MCLLIICFLFIGCDGDTSQKKFDSEPQYTIFGEFPFDASSNSVRIGDKYFKNVYQLSKDRQGNFIIFSTVENYEQPRLLLLNLSNNVLSSLSRDTAIPFDPVVNSQGFYAYAKHDSSVSVSTVYLNEKELALPKGLYKNLAINDYYLVFEGIEQNSEYSKLFIYDLDASSLDSFSIPIVVSKLYMVSDESVYLYGTNNDTAEQSSYFIDSLANPNTLRVSELSDKVCIPTHYFTSSIERLPDLKCYNESNEREELIYSLIYDSFISKDPSLSLACSNNYLGRLSWGVSDKVAALVDILQYEKLNGALEAHTDLPLNTIFETAVNCLLNNAGRDDAHILWPTKKYSLDGNTLLSLAVDDLSVMYPLLKASRLGLLSSTNKSKVTSLFRNYYNQLESDYNNVEHIYHFKYGDSFWADGVALPWNMSNMIGLNLIEAYLNTSDVGYLSRLNSIADSFNREIYVNQQDYSLYWSYWPSFYYIGWSTSDGISKNFPEKNTSADYLYEDVLHAGINVKFIYEYTSLIGEATFSYEKLGYLKNTYNKLKVGSKYARFISGDVIYSKPSLRFIPDYGWSEFNDEQVVIYPSYYPLFEGDHLFDYVRLCTKTYCRD